MAAIPPSARGETPAEFHPGKVWLDTRGKPIQSHSGGVLYDHGTYYWYGDNWDGPTLPPGTIPHQGFTWFFNRGITIYRSTDLVRWDYASTVLADVDCSPGALLQPLNALIRPKIIKNDRTHKFILMAALTAPDFNSYNDIVVAESDSPTGPFKLRGKLPWRGTPNLTGMWNDTWPPAAEDPPTRIRGFDMGLFKDDDGKAYLMVSRINAYLYELADDYLSVVCVTKMEGAHGEAPTLFKADGTYYLLNSRLSGWAANENIYATSRSITGPWAPRGPFAHGPGEKATFDSQVCYVLPVAGRPHAFIFMGDLFGATSAAEIPDLRQARHLWLPIELDTRRQTLRVPWREAWDLSVFGND